MERPSQPSSVYLDSCALIYSVTERPGYEPVAEVLRLGESGKLTVFVSALSLVEVRGWGLDEPYQPELDARCLAVLDNPKFVQVDFHRRLALSARKITYTHRLKNYDAVHLASAIDARVDVFMTWDKRFVKGTTIEGVWIDEPYAPGADVLPGL